MEEKEEPFTLFDTATNEIVTLLINNNANVSVILPQALKPIRSGKRVRFRGCGKYAVNQMLKTIGTINAVLVEENKCSPLWEIAWSKDTGKNRGDTIDILQVTLSGYVQLVI